MTWYEELHVPEGADRAAEWAALHEFELRQRFLESRRSQKGIAEVFADTTVAMRKLTEAFIGDPDLPRALPEPVNGD